MSVGLAFMIGLSAAAVAAYFAIRAASAADRSIDRRERRRYSTFMYVWIGVFAAGLLGPIAYASAVTPSFGEECEAAGGHRIDTYRDTVCVDDEGRLIDP